MSSQSLQPGRSDCEQRWSGWLTRVNLWMTVGFLVIFWHSNLSLSVHNVWSAFSMWNWRLSVSSKGDWLRGLQKISRETQQRQASWLNAYTRFKLECPSVFLVLTWKHMSRSLNGFLLLRSPCLTRARGGCSESFWVTSHRRFMNLQDWILAFAAYPLTVFLCLYHYVTQLLWYL